VGGTSLGAFTPVPKRVVHACSLRLADSNSTVVTAAQHRDPRNPRGADDAVDGGAPIPGEMQVRASAGSVLIQDSRTWHSTATNPSDAPRTSIVCRYCPWWLSTEFSRGQFGFGGCNNARVPRDVYVYPLFLGNQIYSRGYARAIHLTRSLKLRTGLLRVAGRAC
jgi:hypothetical protein